MLPWHHRKSLSCNWEKNRCEKWTPHELSDINKTTRGVTAGILHRRAKNFGVLDSIVSGDEKWDCYDNTTRKQQWLDVGDLPKSTPKLDFYGKKVMLRFRWNSKGLVYFELLESCQTVTADLYGRQLDHVNKALGRQGVDTTSTKLLHDSTSSHVAKITAQKIEKLGWEVLPHAPNSPDTALSNFHLFRLMQHSLAERHFKNHDEGKK
uniref:Transposase n=1 Tax=Caenorhabditis tropicalis TaxID=1561998 RepID=A0A1I7UP52_9PELO